MNINEYLVNYTGVNVEVTSIGRKDIFLRLIL